MFLELVSLGFVLTISLGSASPLPQQPQNQTLKQTSQDLKNVGQKPTQRGSEPTQLRSSFFNQGYYRPASDERFVPAYPDYEHPNLGFRPTSNGFDRRQFRPNGDGGFDSSNFQGFNNGNRPGFGGWNRPLPGDRGFGAGGRGIDSFNDPASNDGNQLGNGVADNQQGFGGSSSGGGSRGTDNIGGSGFSSDVQPSNGGQSWTTVRTPANRIFGEYTIPEIAQCIRSCPSLSQYDPICGSDNITYTNRAKFHCAQQCGRAVTEAYPGSCATATVT